MTWWYRLTAACTIQAVNRISLISTQWQLLCVLTPDHLQTHILIDLSKNLPQLSGFLYLPVDLSSASIGAITRSTNLQISDYEWVERRKGTLTCQAHHGRRPWRYRDHQDIGSIQIMVREDRDSHGADTTGQGDWFQVRVKIYMEAGKRE